MKSNKRDNEVVKIVKMSAIEVVFSHGNTLSDYKEIDEEYKWAIESLKNIEYLVEEIINTTKHHMKSYGITAKNLRFSGDKLIQDKAREFALKYIKQLEKEENIKLH